ncbi:MAG: glycosyltransferase [Desulfobacterales bacterium]|nr:glycosyltransferase [Desulfobacterales bacterium]
MVVPAFNEAENIPLLHRLVSEALQRLYRSDNWELILVDDGSRDATWSVDRPAGRRDP